MDYIPSEVFEELWEKYNRRIYYCFRRQFDEDTSEDLCQQTFMNVWRHLSAFGGRIHKSKSWIFTVAKNVRNDHLRAVQLKKMNYDYANLYENEIPTEYNYDEAISIQRAMEKLTKEEKELLDFSQYLSSREIGTLYGISASAVRSRVQKVKVKLKGYLDETEVDL